MGSSETRATNKLRQLASVAVIQSFNDAIIVATPEGQIISWNAAAERLFGYTAAEIEGQSVSILAAPDRRNEPLELLARLRNGERINECEAVRFTKDGRNINVALSLFPLSDSQGALVGVCTVVRDLTERDAAEEALRRNEARIRSIVDTAVDGIFTINERGIIETVNRAAERIFGYTARELIGQNVRILMPEPYHKEHDGYLNSYLRTGHAKIIGVGREVTGKHKNGTLFPIDLAVSEFQNEGRHFFTGIVRDITTRKRAEQRLAAEHAVARVVAEAATLQEGIASIVKTLCGIFGWDIGDLFVLDKKSKTLKCLEFWATSDARVPNFEALTRQLSFGPGQGLPGQVWATARPVWLSNIAKESGTLRSTVADQEGVRTALGFPILFGEEIVGTMGFFSRQIHEPDQAMLDMLGAIGRHIGQFMERKRVEEELENHARQIRLFEEKLRHAEKLMIIGMLAAELAHEVATPLSIISGHVELLSSREQSNDRIRKDLNAINNQIERITKIIRQRLDLARRKQGTLSPVNLHQLISDLLAFLHLQLEKSHIKVDVSVGEDLRIQGDEDQLQQVFINLFMNSIQAMESEGSLTVESSIQTRNGAQFVEMQIRDSGKGISPEDIEKIFDPFFSTKKEKGGTGLGLSVVREIIQRHGGDILVESRLEHGTTFKIYLPVSVA